MRRRQEQRATAILFTERVSAARHSTLEPQRLELEPCKRRQTPALPAESRRKTLYRPLPVSTRALVEAPQAARRIYRGQVQGLTASLSPASIHGSRRMPLTVRIVLWRRNSDGISAMARPLSDDQFCTSGNTKDATRSCLKPCVLEKKRHTASLLP